ncbi:helix-hairpin-helix domain-containing protein [soil metagenome]
MISAITGELKRVDEDRVHLRVGPVLCELLVPAVDATELQANLGEELTFHTLFYLQGDASGGSIEPRLIGFLRLGDKRFFEKFITVKGIGPKTALRALTVPVGEIAQAIETRDARFLVRLDGIGKRTAELVIAELAGKVQEFVAGPVRVSAPAKHHSAEDAAAIAMLTSPQMGLRRADAERLLERAKAEDPELKTASALVAAMLRMHGARA